MPTLCWYQSLWNKSRHSQKPTLLLNSLFILRLLCLRAYTMRIPDGGRSRTLSPSSTQPRCASVPMETGGFPALRQSRRLSLRAESPGQEAGPIQLIFHAFTAGKSQENTSVVLWRSFSPHTCGFQGFRNALAAVRKTVGAFAAYEGGVVAQQCWNTSPRWKTFCKRIWISFPLCSSWITVC